MIQNGIIHILPRNLFTDIVGTFHFLVSFLVYAKGESSNAGVLKSYLKKNFPTFRRLQFKFSQKWSYMIHKITNFKF